MMTDLSPKAQAVLDAADSTFDQAGTTRQGIAAALHSVTEQLKLNPEEWEGSAPDEYERGWNEAMSLIARISAELKGSDND